MGAWHTGERRIPQRAEGQEWGTQLQTETTTTAHLKGTGVGGREGWLLLVHGWGGFLEESTEIASSDHYAQLPKSGALLSHRENCVCPALDTV